MCKYIMKNGNVCSHAPSMERCCRHPISKFPEAEMDVDKAEEMIEHIYAEMPDVEMLCPCGKRVKRWNYAHHCSFPKHQAWSQSMPQPKTLRTWIATGKELYGFK